MRTASGETMVVVHVLVDTGDAMGANAVNSLIEAPRTAGRGDRRRDGVPAHPLEPRRPAARPRRGALPFAALAREGFDGAEVAERMMHAYEFAAADPYRAATHNKGIMNGIDAVAIATGNDWRAIEAGAHAYACRNGSYSSLTTWEIEGQ